MKNLIRNAKESHVDMGKRMKTALLIALIIAVMGFMVFAISSKIGSENIDIKKCETIPC